MTMTVRDEWRTEDTEALCSALLRLRTTEEMADFLRDLCTLQEIEALSSRWAVVRLLDQGLPYRQIALATGVSTATITRINQWLQHGTGGYRLVLRRTRKKP